MLQKNKIGYYEIIDKPTLTELSSYYEKKYYQEARGSYELNYSQQELDYFNARLSRIDYLIDQHQAVEAKRSFLDVGCGEGFALAYFANKNFEVGGLDFSSAGISKQNPDFIGCVETGNLFDLLENKSFHSQKYAVILLQNVLEHVVDPLALLQLVKQLLEPSGLAIITVPNDFSLTQKYLFEEGCIDREFWVCPPDHLSYFDYESLQSILVHSGYVVHDLISDFPIDWYLFHPGSNYIKDSSNGKPAHFSRVIIENMLHSNDISKVVSFYRSLAQLGAGRDLTVVAGIDHLP